MKTVMSNKKPDESNHKKGFHDVFISYSHQDKEFVDKLHEKLVESNHTVWLDKRDIPYTADWQEDIYRNIVTANNVLCVLSPAFYQSPYCRDEVAYAVKVGKRLVPIEICNINRKEELEGYQELAPLNKIQSIPFQESRDFDHTFKKLVEALDTDLNYIQEQIKWEERALEWENKKRNNGYVLYGRVLDEAEHWKENALVNKKEPPPTDLQRDYITLSRRVARSRQRSVVSLGGVIAVVIVVALVVGLVLQQGLVNAQNALLRSLPVSVTNLNDAGPESLREAIVTAPPGGAITFLKTLKGVIELTSGELTITKNITITGPGAKVLSISGENRSRVFHVSNGSVVTISNLSIIQGSATLPSSSNGNLIPFYGGGGIYNEGSLVLNNVAVSTNTVVKPNESAITPAVGGGILNSGILTLSESDVSHNTAPDWGGGIYNITGTLTILTSTISDNTTYHQDGGGISNSGNATVSGSTFFENSARFGGAIDSEGSISLTNCTLSNNHATKAGGALRLGTRVPSTISYSTISQNTAGKGGGIAVMNDPDLQDLPGSSTSVTATPINGSLNISLAGSIVAGDSAGTSPDLTGTWITAFGNLIQNPAGATFYSQGVRGVPPITGMSPKLGPLQNNGGSTKTMALLPGSPAIDQLNIILVGSDTICGGNSAITTDQRGVARPQGKACDLGAYEYLDHTKSITPVTKTLPVPTVLSSPTPTAGPSVTFTDNFIEFPIPTSKSAPIEITAGPNGNLWFTEASSSQIGRITPAGKITEFPIPTAKGTPLGITDGPDSNLWFTETDGNKIGRITPAGKITEFPIPTAKSGPFGITSGPDGNLWFTEASSNKIGRITPAGKITEFPIPTAKSGPFGITVGLDGNLWFTEVSSSQIGRITPAGKITEFPIPIANSAPDGITAGPDGNLWFIDAGSSQIGRITFAGKITEFPIPTSDSGLIGITAGPDGNLWFTESGSNQIGSITPAGKITEFPVPTANSGPDGITAGPNDTLWFTEESSNQIVLTRFI